MKVLKGKSILAYWSFIFLAASILVACASDPATRIAQKATLLELTEEYIARANAGELTTEQAERGEILFISLKAARTGFAEDPTGSACEIAKTANDIAELLGKESSLSTVDFCSDAFSDLESELEALQNE